MRKLTLLVYYRRKNDDWPEIEPRAFPWLNPPLNHFRSIGSTVVPCQEYRRIVVRPLDSIVNLIDNAVMVLHTIIAFEKMDKPGHSS